MYTCPICMNILLWDPCLVSLMRTAALIPWSQLHFAGSLICHFCLASDMSPQTTRTWSVKIARFNLDQDAMCKCILLQRLVS